MFHQDDIELLGEEDNENSLSDRISSGIRHNISISGVSIKL